MAIQQSKPTTFQKLSKLFGTGGHPEIQKQPSISAKELLTATSAEELMLKKLEAQQAQYLGNQFEKLTSNLYQQSVYYETTRLASYADFMAMEWTPEISASLDLISEESCTLNEFGKMLQVFSNSKRIKLILENLFYNVLDININLPAWTRNTAQFGDNFVYLKSEPKKGIVAVKQLPNIEMRREESSITDQKNIVRFIWQGKSMEFTAWQVAHFRLLGDDRKLPYGTSFLEKARKIWKMLVLAEDAMLVYRITRAPERRIHYIDVGNMDDKDVEPHIQRVAQKLGKRTVQAENTGNFTSQIDVRYSTLSVDQDYFLPTRGGGGQTKIETLPGATNLCIALDTKIPLLDGRTLKLKDIIKEYEKGKENWVYSCNPKTGEIVPGIISFAGVTRKNAQILKITLDNGKEIIATPDHKFLTRNGIKKEAKDLKIKESLMPFRTQLKYIKNIEWLEDKIDTGTITVDGNHKYHNFHTFAIDSGIFIFNSEIQDIEYIQRKLFTAMRIPKAFLGFEEAIGEGKNLALQDIRFARTINRIQQSMIQELNKIAIIHLYMLGFEDELNNFTLTLNNPSTQADMLKIEQWKEKILLYRDMVSDAGNGFAATSMTWAKRNILGFSDDEIKLDLNQQRVEKAASMENQAPEQIIHTGLFDNLDKRYQKKEGEETPEAPPEEGGPGEIPGIGGGPEMGGAPGGEELPPGGPEAGGPAGGGGEALPELTEGNPQLLENKDNNQSLINEEMQSIFEDIDKVLKSGEEISIKKIDENKDLND